MAIRNMSSYRGMDASLQLGFALCCHSCHSNATRAPIANLPNSAQLGGSLYHAPSYIQVRAVAWAYVDPEAVAQSVDGWLKGF